MTLDKLPLGKAATIEAVGGEGALRRHFLNMGLTPGTRVTLRKTAPMGDPIELELRGYELTLRLEDARNIQIGEVGAPAAAAPARKTEIPPLTPPGPAAGRAWPMPDFGAATTRTGQWVYSGGTPPSSTGTGRTWWCGYSGPGN